MAAIKPHNLLIIMADEHSSKVLGCYGHPLVQTPHIDALAANGTRFANAYTNNPICIPSRAAFATGMYTHQTGYWDNVIAYDGRVKSWGHCLQQAGYPVVSIGKLHYQNAQAATGFDRQIIPMHVYGGGDLHGLIRDQPPPRLQSKKLAQTITAGESEFTEYDREITRQACTWLITAAQSRDNIPWTLFVSYICPHFPLTAPAEFFNRYDPSTIPLPKPRPQRSGKLADWWCAFEECYCYDRYFNDAAHRQQALAGYFALCSFIDQQVGELLTTLDKTGLTAATRIAYTSDHGDNLGARGLWAKSTMYQESVGIPLIIKGTDVPANRVSNTPVSLIDFYPTILHGVGLTATQTSPKRPGRSLFDTALENDDNERTVFSEYHATAAKTAQFMLRQGQFKFIYYVDHGIELFDLAADPEELNNLAEHPEQQHRLQSFTSMLRTMLDPEQVDASAKADQQRVIDSLGGREAVLAMPVPYATPAPAN